MRGRQLPGSRNQDIPWFFSSWSVSSFNLFTLLPPSELCGEKKKPKRNRLVPHKPPLRYCEVQSDFFASNATAIPAGSDPELALGLLLSWNTPETSNERVSFGFLPDKLEQPPSCRSNISVLPLPGSFSPSRGIT